MAIVFKLRRGVRHVDDEGNTLLNEEGAPVRDDWGAYTAKAEHVDPMEGELVVEFEYNQNTKKSIPRLKIGDGTHTFRQLEYIGIESFILPANAPKYTYVNLDKDAWESDPEANQQNIFYQVIDIEGITSTSKVDLQLCVDDIVHFSDKDITFTTVNRGGDVRVYAIGQKPTQSHLMYATITEVNSNGNS